MENMPIGGYIAAFSNIGIVILGIVRYSRLSKAVRVLLGLFVVYVTIEWVTYALIVSYGNTARGNTNWLLHLLTLTQFSLLCWMFAQWQRLRVLNRIHYLMIAAFGLFWLAAKLTIEPFSQLDSYSATVAGMLMILAGINMLYQISLDNLKALYTDSRFWISIAVLIYFTGNLIFEALGNELVGLPLETLRLVWTFHWVLTVAVNVLYAIGILCQRNQ